MFLAAAALIVAGVALFVAAPLGGGLIAPRRKSSAELEMMRLEHERGLAVQGLRELEFDREMGKLGDEDFKSMRGALEARALKAMAAIEKLRGQAKRPPIMLVTPVEPVARREEPSKPPASRVEAPAAPAAPVRSESPRPAARRIRFCPRCGARAQSGANFCAECGIGLKIAPLATAGHD